MVLDRKAEKRQYSRRFGSHMGNPGENVGRRFIVLERRDGRREQEEKSRMTLGALLTGARLSRAG